MALALVNFAAGIYSLSYYFDPLVLASPLLWIFIADCPLYAILFGINLLLVAKGKSNPFLGMVSMAGNIKYSLWTIFILFLYPNPLSYWMFFLSHLLLAAEVIVLFRKYAFLPCHAFFAIGWFVINDLFDYYLFFTHPYFNPSFFAQVAFFSLFCSFLVPLIVLKLFSRREK
ncbi:MAG: DUF1405 domain-containing protein [archaeon]